MIGTVTLAISPIRVAFLFCFSFQFFRSEKTRIFTSNTHSVPPKTPVNSYHWMDLGLIEKKFPIVNQGCDNSQL